MKFTLFILSVLLILAACRQPTPAAPTAASTATRPPAADTPALTLSKSGGFAGISQTWTLYADGRLLFQQGLQTPVARQLPAQAVAELLAYLDGSGFFSADFPTPNPDETCCDRFIYELSVDFNNRSNRVVVLDSIDNLPADLAEAFRRAAALLQAEL